MKIWNWNQVEQNKKNIAREKLIEELQVEVFALKNPTAGVSLVPLLLPLFPINNPRTPKINPNILKNDPITQKNDPNILKFNPQNQKIKPLPTEDQSVFQGMIRIDKKYGIGSQTFIYT